MNLGYDGGLFITLSHAFSDDAVFASCVIGSYPVTVSPHYTGGDTVEERFARSDPVHALTDTSTVGADTQGLSCCGESDVVENVWVFTGAGGKSEPLHLWSRM